MRALSTLGTPYHYGGESPAVGFDCSGLIYYSYRQAGVDVPRTTRQLEKASRRIPKSQLRPGDLVFFHIGLFKPDHVGIYLGDGRFIHAPSSGERVHRSSLNKRYWRKRFRTAATFLD